MNVANVLKIGWLKLDKWHLAKHGVVNMGSLGWFVCGFQFDPSLHVAMVWQEKRGLLAHISEKLINLKDHFIVKCFLSNSMEFDKYLSI